MANLILPNIGPGESVSVSGMLSLFLVLLPPPASQDEVWGGYLYGGGAWSVSVSVSLTVSVKITNIWEQTEMHPLVLSRQWLQH